MTRIDRTAAWAALAAHRDETADLQMRDLFAADPDRFGRFSLERDGLLLDFSKNRITDETLSLLLALAEAADLKSWIGRMFAGEKINKTEDRAVFHVALRHRGAGAMTTGGKDVMPAVRQVLNDMRRFTEELRSGRWRGHSGKPIRSVVNIGIGGSDLGPAMATQALTPYCHPDLAMHFVSNVDAADIGPLLARLDPESTLFIVASKTFTTQETMANARTARSWLVERLGTEAAVARHFVAVSTNEAAVRDFGIDPTNMFVFWDWVGGRYSLWSAIGLPIAIAVGMAAFEELLDGADRMDRHFQSAPLAENMPAILALIGLWNGNFLGAESLAVVPYSQLLSRLPAYLQQLEMESNGKRALRDGGFADWQTCPVIWGAPGTNGQHAFFQMMHQGTRLIPTDFIALAESAYPLAEHQAALIANCFAQSAALMRGKTEVESRAELLAAGLTPEQAARLAPHKTYPGNQPSNTILLARLDPRHLGMLIALYEHKVFVQGVLWGLYSFDQWGVELGKKLAGALLPAVAGEDPLPSDMDASTTGLLAAYKSWRRD
ncbi:MAG TPA: glucose-6-phosphate isomerase [Kiloniellaceae bacterium]|nr:glucose-6-phosphate isomerase [Kiloniellaceae bacterium]